MIDWNYQNQCVLAFILFMLLSNLRWVLKQLIDLKYEIKWELVSRAREHLNLLNHQKCSSQWRLKNSDQIMLHWIFPLLKIITRIQSIQALIFKYGALNKKARVNFERDIKSMHSIQGSRKRNSTTGRNMRPYQWILILTPSLQRMLGIIEQCLNSFLRRLVQTCQFSMI